MGLLSLPAWPSEWQLGSIPVQYFYPERAPVSPKELATINLTKAEAFPPSFHGRLDAHADQVGLFFTPADALGHLSGRGS